MGRQNVSPYNPYALEPFKLLRDGNWVLQLVVLCVTIPLAFIAPGSLCLGIFIIPLSSCLFWNALFGSGSYGMYDDILKDWTLGERLKLGLTWK